MRDLVLTFVFWKITVNVLYLACTIFCFWTNWRGFELAFSECDYSCTYIYGI